MLFFVTVLVAAISTLAGIDGPGYRLSPPTRAGRMITQASDQPTGTHNPWAEPARDVLSNAKCGGCHRPGLPTSNPRALAIFNLHDPVWYAPMTDEQLLSLRRRIEHNSEIEAKDQDSVIAFVACKLEGACNPEGTKESTP